MECGEEEDSQKYNSSTVFSALSVGQKRRWENKYMFLLLPLLRV